MGNLPSSPASSNGECRAECFLDPEPSIAGQHLPGPGGKEVAPGPIWRAEELGLLRAGKGEEEPH